jgi:hypothetical protein
VNSICTLYIVQGHQGVQGWGDRTHLEGGVNLKGERGKGGGSYGKHLNHMVHRERGRSLFANDGVLLVSSFRDFIPVSWYILTPPPPPPPPPVTDGPPIDPETNCVCGGGGVLDSISCGSYFGKIVFQSQFQTFLHDVYLYIYTSIHL